MSRMMFFYPKENTRKVLCLFLYWRCVRNGGSRRLGGCYGFLNGDLEDRVINDVMDVVGRP